MKIIRLRAMASLLTEKMYRKTWLQIDSYAHFTRSKAHLLERLPLPRRKKWWEKLAEHQHDHFYQEAREVMTSKSFPAHYTEAYSVIIQHQQMHKILKI